MNDPTKLHPGRWHASYREPHPDHGTWTSPTVCLPSQTAAEDYADTIHLFAGASARARRTWTITPCDGRCRR